VTFSFTEQQTDDEFSEISHLMHSERMRLGSIAGINKQDMSLLTEVGCQKQISYASMEVSSMTGGAVRQALGFKDKGIDFNITRRQVDDGFYAVSSLVDPEKALLSTLMGQEMIDARLKWSVMASMSLDSRLYGITDANGDMGQLFQSRVLWSPDGQTNVEAFAFNHQTGAPIDPLIDRTHEQLRVSRDLGKHGKLTMVQDNKEYDGSTDVNPDSATQSLIYETQLSRATGIRTEQRETKFETGARETTTSNTLTTAITSRAGVSLTDTQTRRDAGTANEVKRNYGFYYDFGKGIKLNYGFNRSMREDANGRLSSTTTLSGGAFQDISINPASYKRERWDNTRDQHIGAFSLASARPLDWGWVEDVQFRYSSDTNRDRLMWRKELQGMGFSGARGPLGFSFDYSAQGAPDGTRAIDRTFYTTSDKTGKAAFQAAVKYGVRTMPDNKDYAIRDYKLSWKPSKDLQFSHTVATNSLKAAKNVMLGTIASPGRTNQWNLNYLGGRDYKAGLFWKEDLNDHNRFLKREGGVDITLFANNASPLKLRYGLAQMERSGVRQTSHSFSLGFTQRPGPNQSLAMSLQNLNWEHGRPDKYGVHNWNVRLDYSVRF
jgi:hypothetical protein